MDQVSMIARLRSHGQSSMSAIKRMQFTILIYLDKRYGEKAKLITFKALLQRIRCFSAEDLPTIETMAGKSPVNAPSVSFIHVSINLHNFNLTLETPPSPSIEASLATQPSSLHLNDATSVSRSPYPCNCAIINFQSLKRSSSA